MRGRGAIEGAVDAMRVVIILELAEFSRQIHRVPEEYPIEILTPDRSNQAFDERMINSQRTRSRLHRLSFVWAMRVSQEGP